MNPQIQITSEDENQLKFTISGANVSIVNGIRRVLLSNIPTVVFKTFPYSENKCDITKNTTRFNNEILKQRLSCIPIHITDTSIPLAFLSWMYLTAAFAASLPSVKDPDENL